MKTINSPRPVGVSGYQKRGGNSSLSALAVLAWGGAQGRVSHIAFPVAPCGVVREMGDLTLTPFGLQGLTPRLTTLLRGAFAWACMGLCLSACSQNQPDYSGTSTVRMYRHNDDDIITLKIPNGYLDQYVLAGPRVPGAREETAAIEHQMFFIAEAGTLKPRSKENNQAFVHPNSLTDELRFNISTIYRRLPQEIPATLQSTYASRSSTFVFSCTKQPQPKQRYGLEWYVRDASYCPTKPPYPYDMLIDRDAKGDAKGDVRAQLFCASDEVPDWADQVKSGHMVGYNPMCEHSYYLPELNARVTLRYARFYVRDWRQLEQRINAMLLSFVQTPSAQ